jgi:hypothetical protein
VPPKAVFNALICFVGPMINVVPVSAIAYVDELTTVDPTFTLFKRDNYGEKKKPTI